jgi:hypothetical protein
VGKTHNIWNTVENSVIEVRKATTKARMLTGTYILQVHATFLIEVFVHVAIENKRLNCLLCISAIIGVAPNRRYTAAVAVLFGNACNLYIMNRQHYKMTSDWEKLL